MPVEPIKSKDRAEELNRLIVQQGHVVRSMQYADWKPNDDEQAEINARAARMIELIELLGAHVNAPGYGGEVIRPERYINDRIAAWLKMNPLMLSQRRNKRLVEDEAAGNLDNGVAVQIGETDKGYHYMLQATDCSVVGGILRFFVPESVAEHFRQQGRRQLQRSLQRELGL